MCPTHTRGIDRYLQTLIEHGNRFVELLLGLIRSDMSRKEGSHAYDVCDDPGQQDGLLVLVGVLLRIRSALFTGHRIEASAYHVSHGTAPPLQDLVSAIEQ